jgi:hypothetical protein
MSKMKQNNILRGATTLFFLLLILVNSSDAWAQKISNVDLDAVRKYTADSTYAFYYPVLKERAIQLDTALTIVEFHYLYYGSAFQDNYSPYVSSPLEESFYELVKNKDYSGAIEKGLEAFTQNPANPTNALYMAICYQHLKNENLEKQYANTYFSLLRVIYASGTGKKLKKAYVVVRVSDEYLIMNDMDASVNMQALIDETDMLSATRINKKGKEETIKVYFNVSLLFKSLMKMFEEEE